MNNALLNSRYHIQGHLGSGGMGEVYKALDIKNNKVVAIKTLIKPDEQHHRRFVREYTFLKTVEHPCLIKAFDLFYLQDKLHMVLEFVSGQSLGDFLETQQELSLAKKLIIAHNVTRAIEVLNEGKILHRDIKPDNIMVNIKEGTVKILDLGIAKDLSNHYGQMTADRAVLGTIPYMSPEQINGKVGEQSDIFSLGTTLYQFFCWEQQSPFYDDNTMAMMLKVARNKPPTLYEKVNDQTTDKKWTLLENEIYQETSQIIAKAMEKKARDRWNSAKEMAIGFSKLHKKFIKASPSNSPEWQSFTLVKGISPKMLHTFQQQHKKNEKKLLPRRKRRNTKKNKQKSIPWIMAFSIAIITLGLIFIPKETKTIKRKPAAKSTTQGPSYKETQKAQQLFEKARHYFYLGDYPNAGDTNAQACSIIENERYLILNAFIMFFRQDSKQNHTAASLQCKKLLPQLLKNQDEYSWETIGIIYEYELGVSKEEIFRLVKQASNHPLAMNTLAKIYMQRQNYQQAKKWLEKALERDSLPALKTLGDFYRYMGGEHNIKQSRKYYEQAVTRGYISAFSPLGDLYFHGIGGPKNMPKAFALFKEATQREHYAQLRLAYFYYAGLATKKDYKKALKYYTLATSAKNKKIAAEAMVCVSLLHSYGVGTQVNLVEGKRWLGKARQLVGKAEVNFQLGAIYSIGFAAKANRQKAIDYYKQAAQAGHIQAKMRLRQLGK